MKVIIINGIGPLRRLKADYQNKLTTWVYLCSDIDKSFISKTSRVKSNKSGDIKEYINWYRTNSAGGLTIVGKTEPNYKDYYPKKPEFNIKFEYEILDDHLIMDLEICKKNIKLFKDLLIFEYDPFSNLGEK